MPHPPKKVDNVVRILIAADFFFNSAFASFAPVLAIFITNQIIGGGAKVAGLAATAYWLTKSIFQLPISHWVDKTRGEKDDFWLLFGGYFLSAFVPLLYLFASRPWHLYAIQSVFGILMAAAVPGWYSIFTRHIDKWKISFEWSLDSVLSLGLASAGAAALGGYMVEYFGFRALFVVASAATLISALLLLKMKKYLIPRQEQDKVLPEKYRHGR